MAYGTIKVDNITFDQGGADQNVTASGIYRAITSGVTVSGTIAGAVLIGTTTVSGATVTGTTANFASGVFTTQVSGATVTGTQSSFTSGNFVTLSGATATFTSGVIASGTAAAPSLSILGDANTGIYSPGADQVAISTNGTGRLFVDENGGLGIGYLPITTRALDIGSRDTAAGIGAALTIRANSTANAGAIQFTNSNASAQNFVIAADTSNNLKFLNNSNAELVRINSSGSVGIGTSSPNYQLHVTTDFAVGASGFNQQLTFGNDTIQSLLLGTGYTALKLNPLGGNVGIGTTSPSAQLHVVGNQFLTGGNYFTDTTSGYFFNGSGGFAGGIFGSNSGNIANIVSPQTITLSTASSERARIDSSGRLLVGTSSSVGYGSLLQVVGGDTARPQIHRNVNDQYPPIIYFSKARGTASQSVSSGDELGQIAFVGYDGTGQVVAATIDGQVDGTPGANDMPGRLVFSVTADGAASPTERMRIDNVGVVSIQTTLLMRYAGINVSLVGYDPDAGGGGPTGGTFVIVNKGNDGSGSSSSGVALSRSATSWSTYSDERAKANLVPIEDGLSKVGALRAVIGHYAEDSEQTSRSFLIAQDVQVVLPQAVDASDPDKLSLRYTEVIPLLVAALKESKERIETLEAAVAALQGA